MADIIGFGDKETSLYLIQIQYLDEQLERCQLKYDELEKQNKDLVSQYSALEKDKKDATENLKCSELAQEKKVDELAERLESQERAAQQDREALKLQHRQQIQQLQERINKLNSESLMQAAQFMEQQEQKEFLMQQLSDMESLKKQLISKKEKHEAAIHSLKKETELEMKRMIKERQKAVENRIKTETGNILQKERAQHSERAEQLRFLQDETVALQKEKDALRDRERDLHVKMDDLKIDLTKITQESLARKKEVQKLTKKCHQLEVELKEQSITHQHMLAIEEALRPHLASVSEECRQKTAKAGQLRAELQRERSRRRQLEAGMQEAVIILRNILEDSEKGSDTRWKMQRLLEVLESLAPQGTGSTLSNSTEKSSRGQRPQTSDPKPARKLCSQKTSSSVDPSDPAPQSDPAPHSDPSDPAPQQADSLTADPNPVNSKKDGCSSSHRHLSK